MSELIKFQLADNSKAMDTPNAINMQSQAPTKKKDEVDSDDELLGDDADYVFMQEYRSKRLEEMTKNQPTSQQPTQISKSQDPSHVSLLEQHKEFGICVETGGDGWFLQEVDEEDKRSTIVVHIYEHGIKACELVNQYMEELASQWVYVKFVRLPASLSGVHVPSNQLPIISIYRGGQLVTAIKSLKQDLMSGGRDTFTREDLEWLLESSDGWTGS